MNYDDKALEVLSNSIKLAIEDSLTTASFDKTTEGRVIASLGNNLYTIQMNGENYSVESYGDSLYNVNDIVKITIPQNDYKKIYILPQGGTSDSGATADEVQSNLNAHALNTELHITQSERDIWNSTVNNSHSNYTHIQVTSSTTWDITHNLNRYPNLSIVDSAGNLVIGEIQYISANQIIISFSASFSGRAYLS